MQQGCHVCRSLHPGFMSTKSVDGVRSVPVCSVACEREWLHRGNCSIISPNEKENCASRINTASPELLTDDEAVTLEFKVRAGQPLFLKITSDRWANWGMELTPSDRFPKRAAFMVSRCFDKASLRCGLICCAD